MMKLKIINVVWFLLIAVTTSSAQNMQTRILPEPQIGWDSLYNKIFYPEIARMAHLWGAYEAILKIDSIGNMIDCQINLANYEVDRYKDEIAKEGSMFISSIEFVFKDLKWIPGKIDDEPEPMEIRIPIIFYFYESYITSSPILIKTTPARVIACPTSVPKEK